MSRQGRRWTRIRRAWLELEAVHRRVLLAHYTLSLPTHTSTGRQRFPTGVEAALGELAGVGLLLAHDAGALPALLSGLERGSKSALSDLPKRATEAVRAAHNEFIVSLRKADAAAFLRGSV